MLFWNFGMFRFFALFFSVVLVANITMAIFDKEFFVKKVKQLFNLNANTAVDSKALANAQNLVRSLKGRKDLTENEKKLLKELENVIKTSTPKVEEQLKSAIKALR